MHSSFFKKSLILSLFVLAMLLMCHNARADNSDSDISCDSLVESPTRKPKRLCFAAENITIITAEEIERMNARTIAEILDTVTGVFVNWNREYTGSSLIHIQGSEQHHVTVFIDGVRWNFLSSGAAETSPIPVDVIESMEIARGPSSSAWGSALGGTVYITNKEGKNTLRTTRALSGFPTERVTPGITGHSWKEEPGISAIIFTGDARILTVSGSQDITGTAAFTQSFTFLCQRLPALA